MTNGDVALVTSLAAAGGAVLASAVTATITYFITRRSVDAAAAEGAATRRHEIDQAWTERNQNRKLDAYVLVARHVGHWSRQIGWALDKASFETDPPTPQPSPDSIDYASEALISLVGSDEVWEGIRKFNGLVMRYLVSVGHARTMDGVKSESEPATVLAAAQAHEKAREAGQSAIAAGKALIDLMRSELRPDQAETNIVP